jgi:peptidoglycan hydrolase-like protein with peptidoglycan-binding domain
MSAMVLTACATTSIASAPLETFEPTVPTTVAPTTVAVTEASTTEATTPPTTVAPTTEAPTTEPPPTAPPTTVDPNALAPMTEPIQGVGRSSGAETQRAQWRLLELGFWVQNANGDYGITTQQAVMAFQKYYGLTADGVLGEQTAAALSSVTERPRGASDAGTLVEIDKTKQLLFFIVDGQTQWILNTSTGSEQPYDEINKNDPTKREIGDAVTRTGLFKVYREREEGWWEGDLGEIYRPKYFSGGEAVHGSNNIPNYPASHGCVRISVPAMDWIWDNNLMPKNIPVWVHGNIPDHAL